MKPTTALNLKRKPSLGFAAWSVLAAIAVAAPAATPAFAHDRDGSTIIVNGVNFSDDDFLQDLIDLDADDIADLRDEFADAREEVLDAIQDIEEAREDVKGVPGGGVILKIAFGVASKTVSAATSEAFDEVRDALSEAEDELQDKREEVGEDEYDETSKAISVIRAGIADIEGALAELTAAMR